MLEAYGNPFMSYRGEGIIYLANEGKIMGNFDCIQLNNSEIRLELIDGTPIGNVKPSPNGFYQITDFDGTLLDGRRIKIDIESTYNIGYSQKSSGSENKIDLLLATDNITIEPKEENADASSFIRFALTNFNIYTNGLYKFRVNFDIKSVEVQIREREGYKELSNRMNATGVCTVTAFMEFEKSDKYIEELLEIAINLCQLLSFAFGTKISWICYEVLDAKKQTTFIKHKKTVISNYVFTPIIDLNFPMDLFNFLDTVYDKFVLIKDQYKLPEIIDVITQSKSNPLAELAALNVSSAVDVLRAIWADEKGRTYILDKIAFRRKRKKLEGRFGELIKLWWTPLSRQSNKHF